LAVQQQCQFDWDAGGKRHRSIHWESSDQIPGQWKFQSAAHVATVVTWTLKALPGNDSGFRYDFAKPYASRLTRIISDAPGSLTLMFADPENSQVAAPWASLHFSY